MTTEEMIRQVSQKTKVEDHFCGVFTKEETDRLRKAVSNWRKIWPDQPKKCKKLCWETWSGPGPHESPFSRVTAEMFEYLWNHHDNGTND